MRTDRVRGRLDGHWQARNAADRALTLCVLVAALADRDAVLPLPDAGADVRFGAGLIFRCHTFDRRRKEGARAGHLDAGPDFCQKSGPSRPPPRPAPPLASLVGNRGGGPPGGPCAPPFTPRKLRKGGN